MQVYVLLLSICISPFVSKLEGQHVCKPDDSWELKELPLIPQEDGMGWCWAASSEIVMSNMNVSISQCLQAGNYILTTTNCECCCVDPRPDGCRTGGSPEFHKYGFYAVSRDEPLEWKDAKHEIACMRRPFLFAIGEARNSTHIRVAYGYRSATNGLPDTLLCYDPQGGVSEWNFTKDYQRVGESGDQTHQHVWYCITNSVAADCSTYGIPQVEATPSATPDEWDLGTASSESFTAEISEVARDALSTLLRSRSPEQLSVLGIPTTNAAALKCGVPMVVEAADLGELRRHPAITNLVEVLRDRGKAIVPIEANGIPCSSITVRKIDNKWVAARFGEPVLINILSKARERWRDANPLRDIRASSVVEIRFHGSTEFLVSSRELGRELEMQPLFPSGKSRIAVLPLSPEKPVEPPNVLGALKHLMDVK